MKSITKSFVKTSSVFVAALLVTACAPTKEVFSPSYSLNGDISGLVQDERVLPSLLYYREGAPGLENYDAFVIDPIQIQVKDDEVSSLSEEELDEAKAYFIKVMRSSLTEGGYEVLTAAKEGAMRITFIVSRISAPNSAINLVGAAASLPVALSVGSVSVEAIFRESVSDRVNAVYAERSRGSMLFNPSPWSTISDIEATFDQWAEGFRASVDAAHNK